MHINTTQYQYLYFTDPLLLKSFMPRFLMLNTNIILQITTKFYIQTYNYGLMYGKR